MSVIQLKEKAEKIGYPLEGGGIPFTYKMDAPESGRGNITNIHIDFSTHAYAPRGFDIKYIYNRSGNYYLRYMGGYSHLDYNTNQQITVKNIVVMITDILGPLNKYGHMDIRTIGSGPAFFFQDGKAIHGSWQRGSIFEPYLFRDSSGKVVSFNAGSTWIAIVQGAEKVSYQ